MTDIARSESQSPAASPHPSPSKAAAVKVSALPQLLSAKQTDIQQLLDELQPFLKSAVELPCIVTCGDESAGKSSVLEAICRLHFPRGEMSYTRFVTELSLRCKPGQDLPVVSTNIRWADARDRTDVTQQSTLYNLAKDIKEAHTKMKKHSNNRECQSFFKDVLQIEASHAEFPNLTLIDLPEILHSGGMDHEITAVHDILASYMRREHTIILAIVTADKDPGKQAILRHILEYDPKGERTMGIITTGDRLEETAIRNEWIKIAGKHDARYNFKYGWHVLRNLGPHDSATSFEERDRQEKELFKNSPWAQLDHTQLGVENLREKLSRISAEQTANALPDVYDELVRQRDNYNKDLEKLGPPRSCPEDHAHYLINISKNFERLTKDAVLGLPDCSLVDDDEPAFRTLLNQHYTAFAHTMYQMGHRFVLVDNKSNDKCQQRPTPLPPDVPSSKLKGFRRQEPKTRNELLDWIQKLCEKRGGYELAVLNPLFVDEAFRELSKNWRPIAEYYVESIWSITKDLLLKAARSSVTMAETHTAESLIRNLISPEMMARREKLDRKLNEILESYKTRCAIAADPDFRERFYSTFTSAQASSTGLYSLLTLVDQYYTSTRRTFIDNVIFLAIEGTLLSYLADVFSPSRVLQWQESPEGQRLIQTLAKEQEDITEQRDSLARKLDKLEKAIDAFPKLLGRITSAKLQSKLRSTSQQTPSEQVEPGNDSSLYDPAPIFQITAPGPSTRRRSSANTHASTVSNLSAHTTLTVPSPGRSPPEKIYERFWASQSAIDDSDEEL